MDELITYVPEGKDGKPYAFNEDGENVELDLCPREEIDRANQELIGQACDPAFVRINGALATVEAVSLDLGSFTLECNYVKASRVFTSAEQWLNDQLIPNKADPKQVFRQKFREYHDFGEQ
ncbi:MAG: hypothetical protein NXI32_01380 [bacterium]|nr:hypothetical protein [bacterium]